MSRLALGGCSRSAGELSSSRRTLVEQAGVGDFVLLGASLPAEWCSGSSRRCCLGAEDRFWCRAGVARVSSAGRVARTQEVNLRSAGETLAEEAGMRDFFLLAAFFLLSERAAERGAGPAKPCGLCLRSTLMGF